MDIAWGENSKLGGMEITVGTCIFFFFFSIFTVSSFELVDFLVAGSLLSLFELSWFGIVFFLQFVFLFSLLPSAARTGDNRRTQVCFLLAYDSFTNTMPPHDISL